MVAADLQLVWTSLKEEKYAQTSEQFDQVLEKKVAQMFTKVA